jgi:hypothetical protein
MKNKIFGRKVGSQSPMTLLLEGLGVSSGGKMADPSVTEDFAIANARRSVQMLRDKNIEGYIVFENDPTHYMFTPETDFAYPAITH